MRKLFAVLAAIVLSNSLIFAEAKPKSESVPGRQAFAMALDAMRKNGPAPKNLLSPQQFQSALIELRDQNQKFPKASKMVFADMELLSHYSDDLAPMIRIIVMANEAVIALTRLEQTEQAAQLTRALNKLEYHAAELARCKDAFIEHTSVVRSSKP